MRDGAAVLDAASDEPSTYQSPTDDASTVDNLDPAAVYFVDASALDLNFDEPSTYSVGGGGGGVESGTGTVRDSSV